MDDSAHSSAEMISMERSSHVSSYQPPTGKGDNGQGDLEGWRGAMGKMVGLVQQAPRYTKLFYRTHIGIVYVYCMLLTITNNVAGKFWGTSNCKALHIAKRARKKSIFDDSAQKYLVAKMCTIHILVILI